MANVRSLSSLARALRYAVLAALCFAAIPAEARIKSERLLAAIFKHTPQSVLVPAGEQMKTAEQAAAAIPGAEAFWGAGDSMQPLFPNGTAIVVAPIKFRDLKKGMTVVYMSSRGRLVAHSLTGDLPGGWIAHGVNNKDEDDDLVTARNLVGVIVEAYSEMHSEWRVALTRELVAKGRLSG